LPYSTDRIQYNMRLEVIDSPKNIEAYACLNLSRKASS